MKIKISDYLFKFIEKQGVKHVFLISGGGAIHMIDSAGKAKNLRYVCNHHEQGSAIAAEAYSRVNGNIGVCITTSGPGGTNAITGVLGAWLDSIPMLVVSGQIKRETIGAGKGLRQLGDQEINIIDIVKPITKYAVMVEDSLEVKYHLEKAVYLAKNGRPGPIWIDLPLDIQGAFVDELDLKGFDSKEIDPEFEIDIKKISILAKQVIEKLQKSKRPVLLIGNGVRLSGSTKEVLKLIEKIKIPVLASFAGYDQISTQNKYFVGRPGTVGQRGANFVLQNSDFLLVLGSRMNIRMVGYNYSTVARKAFKVMVDIDKAELNKKIFKPDLSINADIKDFVKTLIEQLGKARLENYKKDRKDWLKKCEQWKEKYTSVLPEYYKIKKFVNPYCFVAALSKQLQKNDIVAVSNGSACVIPYQALTFPRGTRILVNSGCAAMGYGLPAAIGACFANNKRKTICIEGDGSIQMNLQELQTIVHHNLPIKIFVLNNDGYLSIRMTQKTLFGGRFVGSEKQSGVTLPDMVKIGKAYGIKTEEIRNHKEMDRKIKTILSSKGPVLCDVKILPTQEFAPKASSKQLPDGSFISRPLEDMYPFLSKEELEENMLIPIE